jgi:hypothetical protein
VFNCSSIVVHIRSHHSVASANAHPFHALPLGWDTASCCCCCLLEYLARRCRCYLPAEESRFDAVRRWWMDDTIESVASAATALRRACSACYARRSLPLARAARQRGGGRKRNDLELSPRANQHMHVPGWRRTNTRDVAE